jgi:hypothetical protein
MQLILGSNSFFRWPNLFEEFFLVNSDTKNDDLLFFVRQMPSENEDLDPVFVKRKTTQNSLPPLDDAVLWRETFFLNLIVQVSLKLFISYFNYFILCNLN